MKAMEIEEAVSTSDDPPRISSRRRRRRPRLVTAIAGVLLLIPLWMALPEEYSRWPFPGNPLYEETEDEWELRSNGSASSVGAVVLPQILMEEGIYDASDFDNAQHMAPPYWNASTPLFQQSDAWGPCFKPNIKINWNFHADDDTSNSTLNVPLVYNRDDDSKHHDWQNTAGLCRPGFLILGAGKCGTSSLYHYLVGHPRVLPAVEKQIHYFRVSTSVTIKECILHITISFSHSIIFSITRASPLDGIILGFLLPKRF
jgi:hypothetical protein